MRIREARLLGLGAVALLFGAGCASSGSKPCMVIPAQIELARDVRDRAKDNLEDKQTELGRIKSNLEQSKLHMARLVEERDQLKKEVGGEPTGKTGGIGGQPSVAPQQEGKK